MVDDTQLAESRSIHRETGRTFYYATRLLPERVRHSTYVLYGFFRIADEVVDDPGDRSLSEQRQELEEIRAAALGDETDDPVLAAFSEVREQYDIPDREVDLFIDAMISDIEKDRYRTYEELETYMRGSAAAVGAMMTAIMEPEDTEAALPHAKRLGDAFQLTNFLRDVREDIVERDRIYLPQETLEQFDAKESDIRALRFTDEIAAAIRHELYRAERLYRDGIEGIKYLPQDCQLPVLTAAILYADHHRLIRDVNYDTVSQTPSLSAARKLSLVAKTRYHWAWSKDPETVFAEVSTVPVPVDTRKKRLGEEPVASR
ncbi:MAG: phytoene/squalene synthase family protein [Natronomonas sp.]